MIYPHKVSKNPFWFSADSGGDVSCTCSDFKGCRVFCSKNNAGPGGNCIRYKKGLNLKKQKDVRKYLLSYKSDMNEFEARFNSFGLSGLL